MEELLRPWVHFIPVSPSFDDLPQVTRWCLDHVQECEAIGQNGRCFMRQFFDADAEARVESDILEVVLEMARQKCTCSQ